MQDQPGSGIQSRFRQILKTQKPDIIAFPEYYFVGPNYPNVASTAGDQDRNIAQLLAWSVDFECLVIGGTIVENIGGVNYNRCYAFNKGLMLGHYDKIHLFGNEGKGHISPGIEYRVIKFDGLRLGILICADALQPDSFFNLRGLRPDLIFIPTTSPLRPAESVRSKFSRDKRIFAVGAANANAIVLKISASGFIAGHPLQGRSLIAGPDGIHWRIEPGNEDKAALVIAVISGEKRNPHLDIAVYRP